MPSREEQVEAIDWWHTIDLPGYGLTPGREPNPRSRDAYLNIPEDLTGKIVLDIGAWDGLYSFVAEERGATKVVATDIKDCDGLALAIHARRSNVLQVCCSAYELDEELTHWQPPFDVVFFFGVLYHLEDPMRALRAIACVTKPGGLLILETDTCMKYEEPVMLFTEHGHHGDETNVWYPNPPCVEAMMRKAGFEPKYQGGQGTRKAWHGIRA